MATACSLVASFVWRAMVRISTAPVASDFVETTCSPTAAVIALDWSFVFEASCTMDCTAWFCSPLTRSRSRIESPSSSTP